jgi:anaerobic selenocysteine-containing dehydrogenase
MTNHWIDVQNCKTILVEGGNVAENQPMAFKWIRNGAKHRFGHGEAVRRRHGNRSGAECLRRLFKDLQL